MMEHNGADMMANELCDLNSYKDPLSPKCSPSGPLNEPWSPGSPSSSGLQERFHEESEEIDSAIEEVLCHITYVLGQAIGPLWDFCAPISIIVEL